MTSFLCLAFMTKPYEVVIDASQFGAQNDIRNQWATQFFQLMPFDASNNLHTVYIYNCNNGVFIAIPLRYWLSFFSVNSLFALTRVQKVFEAHVDLCDQQSPEEVRVRVLDC